MSVVLLDCNWQFHQTVSVQRAIKLICRGVVEVVKNTEEKIHDNFFVPAVLRLIKAIRKFYGKAVQWSKTNLFVRDGYTCQYCGKTLPAHKLTVDHIVPQARAGKTEWENCVAACHPCNNKKDDKSLRECNFTLKKKPVQPTIMEFAQRRIKILGVEQLLKDLGVY
jgi:5-methylcytosine-specific restriction endonuclease McrA